MTSASAKRHSTEDRAPGCGFDDSIMVVLDSPTYNCTLEETEYGLAKTCVGALLAALDGLRGLSTSSHDLVQVFTVLPRAVS
jgi:hypothetical protein